jgi:hypothetical protein
MSANHGFIVVRVAVMQLLRSFDTILCAASAGAPRSGLVLAQWAYPRFSLSSEIPA